MPDPVAVTGIGCVTPLGMGAETLHASWLAERCAIESGFGRCRDFAPAEVLTRREIRRTNRYVQMALVASAEAVAQAGWGQELPYAPDRVACVIATTTGGQEAVEREFDAFRAYGAGGVAPLRVLLGAGNGAPVSIAMRLNLQGECYGLLGACAGGAQAIGAGMRMVRAGAVDAAVVGGADAEMSGLVHATYGALGALSASGVCRPFDRRRDGMIPGEGAGVLVIEDAAKARARGARILGELLGYGAGNDAHHLTVPHSPGQVRTIQAAISDAAVAPAEIAYVNAHGTGTRHNDVTETTSLKATLGEHARSAAISSLKSAIGHLQGAAGAVEAIATLLSLRDRVAPPTLGLEQAEEGLDLDYVPLHAHPLAGGHAPRESRTVGMTNSFGLGGHNACLVMRA
jgi:3-oxoacyl-[acyl-carrier-protein] synthase II